MSTTQNAVNEDIPAFLVKLRDEHRYFQSLLDIAREQQKLIEAKEPADLDTLQEALQYLAEYPEDCHHPREDLMFERLRERDEGSHRMLDHLLDGHESIHRESNRLYFMVMRVNNGERGHRKRLAADLLRFVDAYERHMDDEDNVIFLRALNVLDENDWADLEQEMADIDDPLFGTRVRRRYRHLANELEGRLGIAKRDLVVAEYLSLGAVIDNMVTVSETVIELAGVVRENAGTSLRQNLTAARDGLASKSFVKIVRLPAIMTRNSLDSAKKGIAEARTLLGRAVEDVRTPYTMRVDTLKSILRDDWAKHDHDSADALPEEDQVNTPDSRKDSISPAA